MTDNLIRYVTALWRFLDVVGWQKWFGAAVVGFAFALSANNDWSVYGIQGLLIGVTLALCYNQSVNDCFDISIDQLKEKAMGKELVVSNIISVKMALALTFSILALGLLSAWFTSVNLFIVCSFMAFLGTIYSAPPLRLKMAYPYSTGSQFIGCFLPFLAGVSCLRPITLKDIAVSSIFAMLAMTHRFEHEIENYEVDRKTNKKTVAVVNGLRTAEWLKKTCIMLGVVEFILFFIFGWFSLVFLLFFLLYLVLCIDYHFWFRRLPRNLRKITTPVIMVSGFVLLFLVLLISGRL